ncbi:hypothetical protein M427DRAFT_368796 [Gonapodya prolifera JEL478]|uniref:RNI-like protein n=1 Tax=Gonapodya prolifera (strain JEL478) TaxID=1344416 RepID=A0A139A9J1_GONPJ|nr:hypothetical protein M427DRAFT_368796 [Gonapodya prolifera JEL478]|eukprot:KXS13501.1 hypothetical protein M427DRAFT_368796 [Gonapodya prolifera JEL478]
MPKKKGGLNNYLRDLTKAQSIAPEARSPQPQPQPTVSERIERSRALAARKRSTNATVGASRTTVERGSELKSAICEIVEGPIPKSWRTGHLRQLAQKALQHRIRLSLTTSKRNGSDAIPSLRRICLTTLTSQLDIIGATEEATRRFFHLPDDLRDEILLLAPYLVPESIPANLRLFCGERPSQTLDLSGTMVSVEDISRLFPQPKRQRRGGITSPGDVASWEDIAERENDTEELICTTIPRSILTAITVIDLSGCPNVRLLPLSRLLVSCTPKLTRLSLSSVLDADQEGCVAGLTLASKELTDLLELDLSNNAVDWLTDSFVVKNFGEERCRTRKHRPALSILVE